MVVDSPNETNKRERRQQLLQRQVARLSRRLAQQLELSERLSRARLILFVLAALVSGFTFINWGAVPWLLVSMVAFIPFFVMVVSHRRVETAVTRLTLWHALKQTHVARMTLDWAQLPQHDSEVPPRGHPFVIDLDLIGPRSLHHLLDTTASREASTRLRQWLLAAEPQPAVIEQRQTLVAELAQQPIFRDKLSLQAALVGREERFSGQILLDWLAAAKAPGIFRPILFVLSLLALVNIALFLLSTAGLLPGIWIGTWLLYVGLYFLVGNKETGSLFDDALMLQNGLGTLQGVFGFLEKHRYGSAQQVRRLCQPFLDKATRPSQHIRRAKRVVTGVGIQQNPFLGLLINAIVPWNLFFAYRMSLCQQDLAERLPVWLDRWTELETLNCLATFAWLNPDVAHFPQLRDEGPVHFAARGIGHPLVGAESRIANDFELDGSGRVQIITGSNMAGKSTFLRTLGINLVLAYAGAPVIAHSLASTYFRLFASIRVADSLADGYSFFYAEVRRLEMLLSALKMADERPLFYLIDEIFRGTNNRERLVGSRAYIKALVDGNGSGLIATHDLELVHLAEQFTQIRNYHFRDDVVDGRMVFDYLLHEGPCPTTNALKIMKLAGLPVADEV